MITKKDGSEPINFTAFYEALLSAKGLDLGTDSTGRGAGKGGRKLSHTTKVQFNGNLMVGKAYTAMLDLKPGDEFEIKLVKKHIRLVLGGGDEEECAAGGHSLRQNTTSFSLEQDHRTTA